jgi:hypothetical protein
MTAKEVAEIRACLPKGRTTFPYFKDRYAVQLLAYALGEGRPVHELRQTPLAGLLQKPALRPALARAGGGLLTQQHLFADWPTEGEMFRLSLGRWGRRPNKRNPYYQTSRPGHNLVLRLNFCNRFAAKHKALFRFAEYHPCRWYGHPVAKGRFDTLAWARMDIDLGTGEVLIEEIQNDWLRDARRETRRMNYCKTEEAKKRYVACYYGDRVHWRHLLAYFESILATYQQIWAEAMLAATLWFIREELGICTIYYHTWDSGNRLKGFDRWETLPPRSLYSALPKRFCFAETDKPPSFLQRDWGRRIKRLNAEKPLQWYVMHL